MPQRLLRWWRRAVFRLRPRRTVGVVTLLGASAGLLAWASATGDFQRDLLLNIGASVLVIAFSYAIIDPIFEELRRSRVEEHPLFDDQRYSDHVRAAERVVAIMDVGSHLLEGQASRERFLDCLRAALRNGVTARLLLLDPSSTAAEQREEEIRPVRVRDVICDNLRYLDLFTQTLPEPLRARFQVRVYDALPSIQLYRWDDKGLISFFPIGVRASASAHLEVVMSSPLGEFVHERFEALWHHPSTRPLTEYMEVPVSIRHGGAVIHECEVRFVELDGVWYVEGARMLAQLTDHGTHGLDLVLGDQVFTLSRAGAGDGADQGPVTQAFRQKYGQSAVGESTLIMKLAP
ncbi:hypothetical protein Aph01nite_65520 [Acrocarpospora phusangensis]|uniref:Uncharacterized protein n=1 Tax=Acrocarpospora phusangensis TaxID=1070424 RepID=A0A919QL91_9ACTN|nr:hypothetical protein [Acrocarpospora phusangensis]GIH28242.1 hypothetical protein Aph01nite_65520 [Acrocarpospora phusangensis]